MLRAILPPLIAAYATFVAMVVVATRRPVPRPRGDRARRSPPVGALIRTTAGGYAAFLAIVAIFHAWLAREPGAFANALWGGAFLCGVALAAALVPRTLGRRGRDGDRP